MKQLTSQELKRLAIQDAKNFLNTNETPTPVTSDEPPNIRNNNSHNDTTLNKNIILGNDFAKDILSRWLKRNSSNIASSEIIQKNLLDIDLNDLKKSTCTIVCGPVPSKHIELIESFKNVFCIVGDYQSPRPQGIGECIVDINHSNFCKFAKGPIRIYLNNLTGRPKVASKIWKNGDIRSFKHIDPIYYSKSFEVQSGRIPSTPIATLLMVQNLVPKNSLYLYGYDLSDLNAWDQQILYREGTRLCH